MVAINCGLPTRARHLRHLCMAALVGPDDGRGEQSISPIEQHRAVHLSGNAEGGNPIGSLGHHQRLAHRLDSSLPPCFGLLFGVGRVGMEDWVFTRSLAYDFARAVYNQCFDRRSSQVDA